LEIENQTFEIHITSEDPSQDAHVLAFRRYRKKEFVKKSKEGKDIHTKSLALFTPENEFINKVKNDEDLLEEFLDTENDVDMELAGKEVGRTATLLLTGEDNALCYNFTEYEIKKDRKGKIIPCEECGQIYCEHRIKSQIYSNVNNDDTPIIWIKKFMMDKREVLRTWSFDRSYQIIHTNGLTYDFLFKMAKLLNDLNKVVFIAPIINKKPEKLVIRTGNLPFYGWLEGRVKGDQYALVIHGTTFKLTD